MKNTALDATALTLSIIGAVNWGLIGLFKFDLVAFLFWKHDIAVTDHLYHSRHMRYLSHQLLCQKRIRGHLSPRSFKPLSIHSLIISLFQAAF